MKPIELGTRTNQASASGKQSFHLDPERLLDTRMLVMASSGGGKSWFLRKLIEGLHGQVQIIVLDIEGEFGTLRSHYPFVLAGKGGDITADPRYADTLAKKLLELRADTICDLYELKQLERIRFVRLFLEAMINAPKDLWRPVVVILDEGHLFCPEDGKAESANAVIDLASRGRKRGFSLVVATQRLSKLNKGCAAELQNKVIGLANIDLDRKRGAGELGFSDKDDILAMRDLDPGDFFALGPAFDFRGVQKVKIGKVVTAHPKSGSGRLAVHMPAPGDKIKAVLAKLADIPREAEKAVQDMASLKARIKELEAEMRRGARAEAVDPAALEHAVARGIELGRAEQRQIDLADITDLKSKFKIILANANLAIEYELGKLPSKLPMTQMVKAAEAIKAGFVKPTHILVNPLFAKEKIKMVPHGSDVPIEEVEKKFGRCERSILAFLELKRGIWVKKSVLAPMSGYAVKGGSFNNALGKSKFHIDRQGTEVTLKQGIDVSHLTAGYAYTLDDWIERMGKCEREIYNVLLDHRGRVLSKVELADLTPSEYEAKGGSFNNALGRLNAIGLITRYPDGGVGLNTELES